MRRFRFPTVLIAIVVSVAVPTAALLSCMADQTDTAMTQMACCKTARPNCGASSKGTMECCKTGNHADQQNVAKIPTVPNPLKIAFISPAAAMVDTATLLTVRQAPEPVTLFGGTTSPPRLVFSALLI